nr:putative ribonuclease H-like domain-containing protein [Tanacetum cinerariifolium]
MVKRSGDITRLQALVDKMRIVITEEVVREILQLNDAKCVICLPNEEIFAGLARMGYEKPSTKLTFYKAFFSTQWKFFIHMILLISWQCKKQTVVTTYLTEAEYVAVASGCAQVLWMQNQLLDYGIKFDLTSISNDSPLLGVNTPRCKYTHNVVAILEKSDAAEGFDQIIDFLSGSYIYFALTVNLHIYISCIKQFWNFVSVKRSGDVTRLQALVDKKKIVISKAVIHEILQLNDVEGVVETPFFEGMIADSQPADEELGAEHVQDDAAATAAFIETVAENVSHDDAEFSTRLQQVLNVCSALSKCVENLETDNAAQKLVIIKLKARVKKLEKANKIKSSKLRRLRKVGTSRRVESSDDMEDVFNQERMIADIDMNKGIELVKDAEGKPPLDCHLLQEMQAHLLRLEEQRTEKSLLFWSIV